MIMAELGCSFGKSSLTSIYCTYKAKETKDIVIILHSSLWLSNDFDYLFHDREEDDVHLRKLNQLQERPRPGVYNMLFEDILKVPKDTLKKALVIVDEGHDLV